MEMKFDTKLDTSRFATHGAVSVDLIYGDNVVSKFVYYVVTRKDDGVKGDAKPEANSEHSNYEGDIRNPHEWTWHLMGSRKRNEGDAFTREQYAELMRLREKYGGSINDIPKDSIEVYLDKHDLW